MATIRVFYDGQCEVCQAGVSWLRLLDRHGQVECIPIQPHAVAAAGLNLEACLAQLHIVTPKGVLTGWDAVARLARLFPATWVFGAIGATPPFRQVAARLYRWVAANRYALSKCRGGACRSYNVSEVQRRAPLGPLRSCYWFGLFLFLPLSGAAILRQVARNLVRFGRTWRRRIDLLDGRLSILMLNGWPCDLITLLFGEHFAIVLYDGIAIDPGPTRLRGALARHLRHLAPGAIRGVVATHHHEEHAGNLNWLAGRTGAAIFVGADTAQCLAAPTPLPWIRRFMIGERTQLLPPFHQITGRLGEFEVLPSPGHCHDHLVFYHRCEKILFAGDSFMGAWFSAPNPDVDSLAWIETLRRLLDLDIEILLEGHGFIHTLRPDIPDSCPLLVREDPRRQLLDKLRFCEWMRDQVAAGTAEGLPPSAIQVTCFPWGRRFAWENFFNDELSRMFSCGHWSRAEVVRSFVRPPESSRILPMVYEARIRRP